jgi:hypothetical protein
MRGLTSVIEVGLQHDGTPARQDIKQIRENASNTLTMAVATRLSALHAVCCADHHTYHDSRSRNYIQGGRVIGKQKQ